MKLRHNHLSCSGKRALVCNTSHGRLPSARLLSAPGRFRVLLSAPAPSGTALFLLVTANCKSLIVCSHTNISHITPLITFYNAQNTTLKKPVVAKYHERTLCPSSPYKHSKNKALHIHAALVDRCRWSLRALVERCRWSLRVTNVSCCNFYSFKLGKLSVSGRDISSTSMQLRYILCKRCWAWYELSLKKKKENKYHKDCTLFYFT